MLKMRILRALGWLLLASRGIVEAKSEPDIVEANPFPGIPDALYYFEDSETILTIDDNEATLYMSTNGGRDWIRPADVDQRDAIKIFLHPRDNKIAVVTGNNKKHWITEDQGESWRTFETPEVADLYDAISFHYSDPKKMLFHTPHYMFSVVGKVCTALEDFKWSLTCARRITLPMDSRQTHYFMIEGGIASGLNRQICFRRAMTNLITIAFCVSQKIQTAIEKQHISFSSRTTSSRPLVNPKSLTTGPLPVWSTWHLPKGSSL